MSLIRCPECNKEISDTAKVCPNCGYKRHKIKKNKIGDILIKYKLPIVGIIVLSFLLLLILSRNSNKEISNEEFIGNWYWDKNYSVDKKRKKLDKQISDYKSNNNGSCENLNMISGITPNYELNISENGKIEYREDSIWFENTCDHGIEEIVLYGTLKGDTITFYRKTKDGKTVELRDEKQNVYFVKIDNNTLTFYTKFADGSTHNIELKKNIEEYVDITTAKSDNNSEQYIKTTKIKSKNITYDGPIYDLKKLNNKEDCDKYVEAVNKYLKKYELDYLGNYEKDGKMIYYYGTSDKSALSFTFYANNKFEDLCIIEGGNSNYFNKIREAAVIVSGMYTDCYENSNCKSTLQSTPSKAKINGYTFSLTADLIRMFWIYNK